MRVRPIIVVALFAQIAHAQAPDTPHHVPGTTVSGVVRDSIAHMPLNGAIVELVLADAPRRQALTAISDSLGRFTIMDVPDGRHMIGFVHPMLDSLGLETPVREVRIDGHRPVRTDLAIPSAGRLREAICGVPADGDSGAVIIGIVREAQSKAPATGVTVTAEWMEVSFRLDGMVHRVPRIAVTTGDNGWFALCDVPALGTTGIMASRGADSTDRIDVDLSGEGLVRRELYIGSATGVAVAEASPASTNKTANRRVRRGKGVLSGVVRTVAGARPLTGAQVSISGGPETRTNENGEWIINDAPVGTRMLEIRALGYYPDRRRVDVVPDAPPVFVALSTLKAVLDTVKIRASRLRGSDKSGFNDRRRTGVGRYISQKDIERRPVIQTSDIFKTLSGVRLGYAADTLATDTNQIIVQDSTKAYDYAKRVLIRGISGDWCAPAIYVNGLRMPGITADDIDAWVRPKNVVGIEIYSEADVPTEWEVGRSGCGSIVIWTK